MAKQDADLVHKLPRPLKKVISLGCDLGIKVCFEEKLGLSAGHVVETLREKYTVRHDALPDENEKLGGYFYGIGTRAFIFYETQYGEGFERFTIAHEAGHLFLEFVPLVMGAQQGGLFQSASEPVIFAARDTPGELLHALDSLDGSGTPSFAEHKSRKRDPRETKANGFAAEFLAPFEAVQKVVNEHPNRDHDHYVALLRHTFKLSKNAARIRLAELADEAHPDQEILHLLG